MGSYLNPGGGMFKACLRSKIYVDKSGLIAKTNEVLGTEQRFVCVSRPRRFGKSMAANMLAAYYGRGEDSAELFSALRIHTDKSFREHLNQYDVIRINMQEFLSAAPDMDEMLKLLQKRILRELKMQYPDYIDSDYLVFAMQDVFAYTRHPFVILIDEWDCIFREFKQNMEAQKKYLDFLRVWLKDQEYVALAYMTGILPIKKYGSHSALNMFTEYSMTNPREMAEFFGFTEEEVHALCATYKRNFEEAQAWYDGYELVAMDGENPKIYSMYSPKSVVDAMLSGIFDNYWNQTETFEALQWYIDLNFDGLRDDVLQMMAGKKIPVNTGSFTNDMTTFRTEDDVLTLLIHLGYLGYEEQNKYVFIPNAEVQSEYASAVTVSQWGDISKALKNSADLLQAVWEKQETQVAEGIRLAHFETSQLQYNDENALSYTISLALYAARNFYTVYRELPGGKGFADLVFVPRKRYQDKPALVVELKWDKTAEGALAQIKDKEYCRSLEEYQGNLLLVGINYNKKTKEHVCRIEEYQK